jgi:hypothetical protein
MAPEQLSLFGLDENTLQARYGFYRHEQRAIEELIEILIRATPPNDPNQRDTFEKLINTLRRLPYQTPGIEITLSASIRTEDDRYTCSLNYCQDWINFSSGGAIYDKLVGTDFFTDMDLYIYPDGEPSERDYNDVEIWVGKLQTLFGEDANLEIQDYSSRGRIDPPDPIWKQQWEDCPLHWWDEDGFFSG